MDIIIFIVAPIMVYIIIKEFLRALKIHARDKAKYNLAKEWYDLSNFPLKATKTNWNYVWVKDKAGNEFICPIDALKDPQKASKDELKNCKDDAKA